MTDSSPLLKLENVSREFPSAEGDQPLRVLRGLSLEVAVANRSQWSAPPVAARARC